MRIVRSAVALAALVLAGWLGPTACGDTTWQGLDAGDADAGDLDAGDGDAADQTPDGDGADGIDGGADLDPGGDGADAGTDGADEGPACAGLDLAVIERGDLALGDSVQAARLEPCSLHRYRLTAPAGMLINFALQADPDGQGVELSVALPDAPGFDQALFSMATHGQAAGRTFGVPRSGEFFVLVRAADPDRDAGYELSVTCVQECARQASRYPIVLVHGWTGWDEIGAYTYFYGVADRLTAQGFLVYTASLDPYNSVQVRSEQLAEQIDGFLEAGRAERVNLIAHSQGGLDARRAISSLGYADRVASLITISTPHQGTPIADVALGLLPGFAEDVLAWFLEWLGATVVGSESDAIASFESITTSYVQDEFNPANPDAAGVAYISYAGKTCPLGLTCGDACDVEIRFAYYILLAVAGANDGMIPVESAKWGDYRGEIPADHFDEIGQLAGITGPNFDHLDFYLGLARDLAADGF